MPGKSKGSQAGGRLCVSLSSLGLGGQKGALTLPPAAEADPSGAGVGPSAVEEA